MTINLTVATASEKMRVVFCNLFFNETNSEKWKRGFTTYDLRRFAAKQTDPKSSYLQNGKPKFVFSATPLSKTLKSSQVQSDLPTSAK